ncbi:helix-turn-helix domain-containing protein [Mycolicibacterium fortuitum]|uniref:helix-turn-helix domain-containing protein n=1 Tax=Mycolicibacterium fortuitum TaxID=1766 RepID=UPI0007EB94DC|nr:helix-turn-helix domain-containing protein [Mycolicibacterium fortuitum]OBB53131.1 hypothetical protein A5754_21590 [Mycolicibacterium fortuitum]OBB74864.1 hypothetical protein A5755_14245 [Mycolicibacterium fortuitum]OBF84973.1 hypothetical protein A5751_10600 [Mycolicibacterium fortuitum]
MTDTIAVTATDPDTEAVDEVLGREEAANYLKISLPTFMDLIKRGELRAAKVGRQWRIKRSWIEEYLENAAAASA